MTDTLPEPMTDEEIGELAQTIGDQLDDFCEANGIHPWDMTKALAVVTAAALRGCLPVDPSELRRAWEGTARAIGDALDDSPSTLN